MVNLVSAKCPNCGAQLELDDNMKRAECSFCKSTIIVDDAIAKYKIEISGKVEVDGIKSDNKRMEEAKKYFKIQEYEKARNCIKELLKNDELSIEVQIELIKTDIEIIRQNNYKLWISKYNENISSKGLLYFNEIIDVYNRIVKLDEKETYKKNLKEYEKIINEYLTINNNMLECEKYIKEILPLLHEHYNKTVDNIINWNVWCDCFQKHFLVLGPIAWINDIGIDGSISYRRPLQNGDLIHKTKAEIEREYYSSPSKLCDSIEDLKKRYDSYELEINDIITKAIKKKNKLSSRIISKIFKV